MSTDFYTESKSTSIFAAMIVPGLVLICIVGLVHLWTITRRKYKMVQNIPGPTILPFFGNALMVIGMNPNRKFQNILK